MAAAHHRYATVRGRRLFYREAGPAAGPTVAFAADAPGAGICLLDGGHFLLESHLDIVADHVRRFLGRTEL